MITEYVSVIATGHFWSIAALLEKLGKLDRTVPNEVQTSTVENGYAIGIISLAVFLLESLVGRAQYLEGIQPPKNPPANYFAERLGQKELAEEVEEFFVLRDIIAHNHLWDAKVRVDRDCSLRLVSAGIRKGYGDKKFQRIVDMKSRKTFRLRLNAFPTRIWYNDAVIVLKKVAECLELLDAHDHRVLEFEMQIVRFNGQTVNVRRLINSLTPFVP